MQNKVPVRAHWGYFVENTSRETENTITRRREYAELRHGTESRLSSRFTPDQARYWRPFDLSTYARNVKFYCLMIINLSKADD